MNQYDVTIGIRGEGYSERTFRVQALSPGNAEIIAMREWNKLVRVAVIKTVNVPMTVKP